MNAKVKYSNGYVLEISKENNSMLLFLEYVSDLKKVCFIHAVINESDIFKIRLNTTKKGYQECCNYINSNL
jgi:hypothetical protein